MALNVIEQLRRELERYRFDNENAVPLDEV